MKLGICPPHSGRPLEVPLAVLPRLAERLRSPVAD
jgi:hypothetical protein